MEPLRSTGLLYPELCVQLFDGVASIGLESYGTASTIPDPYDSDPNLNEDLPDTQETGGLPSTQETGGPTSTQECSSRPPVQSKKRKAKAKEICASKKVEIEETILKVMNVMLEKHGAPKDDLDDCLKKLEGLGWGAPLHDVALFVLGESADYRKMWMRLEPVNNFIRKCNIHDQLFMDYDNDPMFIAEGQEGIEGGDEDDMDGMPFGTQNNQYMTNLRDQIANQLMLNPSN